MTPSLPFLTSNSKMPPQSCPTTPSLQIQMPTVYVVPPEEDQTPTWCCFDASSTQHPVSHLSNLKFLDHTVNLLHHTEEPLAPVNPPRAGNRGFSDGRPSIEQAFSEEFQSVRRQRIREIGEDSDIIEVVTVGRKGKVDNHEARRPKGFKHHATKAFRTLKLKRGKFASQPKPDINDNDEDEFGRTADPRPSSASASISRRPSLVLTQLFSPKPRASYDQPYSNPGYSSTVPSLNFLNAEHIYPEDEHDSEHYRSASPSLSTRTFSTKRRFSILGLHKIFTSTPSNSPAPNPYPSSLTSPQSVPSLSQDSSGPSISSRSSPSTPTEEHQEDDDDVEEDFGTPKDESLLMQDISFEMRLDSLHFESLSFNPDDF